MKILNQNYEFEKFAAKFKRFYLLAATMHSIDLSKTLKHICFQLQREITIDNAFSIGVFFLLVSFPLFAVW